MKCLQCGIEFESKRADAKYCSPNCKLKAFRKSSIETDNVTLSTPIETDNFKFTVTYNRKPGNLGYDADVAKQRATVRIAKYWYDVPLGAVPVYEKDWPKMPEYMNGRQYFLWWKNEFKTQEDGTAIIHNPRPVRENVQYVQAGQESRRWGA